MKTTFFILFILSLWSINSNAEFSNAQCAEVTIRNDVIQLSRQWREATKKCFITITPRHALDLKYRDYYFDNTGFFMVFNSFGEGPDSEMAGSRVFYLFPVIADYPDYSFETNGDVIVKLVSGHQFRVSGKDFSILSLSDAVIQEKSLSKNNAGGVEFKLTRGFWLDAGFRLGGTRLDSPTNKSTFRSAQSKENCTLVNHVFLNYVDGEFIMKYTGSTFNEFIKKQCPQLKIGN